MERWGAEPGFVELLAERLVSQKHRHVVFTAHSLPARILAEGDPYQEELLETARLVTERAGVKDWSFSFQSESPTGEPWLGPDILEIRWDVDVEAQERAAQLGIGLDRIDLPNADPAFVRVLAGLVRRAAAVPSVT